MVTFLTVAALVYAGICVLVYLFQDRLLFFPVPSDRHATGQLNRWHYAIDTSEARLSGWVVPARDPQNSPLVFYFGGNAEDVSLTALEFRSDSTANSILMNYRGYGASEGTPSQTALFADAVLVYDKLVNAIQHNGKVVAFGRSLGSGVAIHLAAQRPIDALVLVTPYDSIRNVAHRHFRWLPVSLLVRQPFDSLAPAARIGLPALFLVAEHDEIIPPVHARNLADHWGGNVHWNVIEGATHNSIGTDANYWQSIREFLAN